MGNLKKRKTLQMLLIPNFNIGEKLDMEQIILIKLNEELESRKPVYYQDLIMNGTINEVLGAYSKEIAGQTVAIESELRKHHQKPITDKFVVLAQYENMIRNLKMELLLNMVSEKITSM
jgi:hypothetical protein